MQAEIVSIEPTRPQLTELEELKVALINSERALCRSNIAASQMRLRELDRNAAELDAAIGARLAVKNAESLAAEREGE